VYAEKTNRISKIILKVLFHVPEVYLLLMYKKYIFNTSKTYITYRSNLKVKTAIIQEHVILLFFCTDIWNLIYEIWYMKSDIWNQIYEIWYMKSDMKSDIWYRNISFCFSSVLIYEIWYMICNMKSDLWYCATHGQMNNTISTCFYLHLKLCTLIIDLNALR
jgi:uncharacterized pyridoxamine 5'-phosphate oxidase family protein